MKPVFNGKYVAVVMSVNELFIPYLSTFLLSVMEHSLENHSYDFIVLNRNIRESSKKIIQNMIEGKENFSVRFYDVGTYFDKYNLFVHEHFSLENYFRLVIPDILEGYEKVLYMDADIVVKTDIYNLLEEDISGNILGAVLDTGMLVSVNENENINEILKNMVGIEKPEQYFNSGVLLIDVPLFQKKFDTKYLLKIAASKKWPTVDQDVLNFLCKGQVKFLDLTWNLTFDYIGRMEKMKKIISKKYYNLYLEARKSPKIIHYAGCPKPWQIPESDFTADFWEYAKKSPFYERIISNMCDFIWEREA